MAEGGVIIVSILLAFTVDAAWDSRNERAREAEYLRQLVVDMEATLSNNAVFGGRAEVIDRATERVVQSYYEAAPPQADSVAHWFSLIAGYWVVQPRLGTVQSLVSTGDLALIRDDSLRIAIPNFLSDMVAFEGFEDDGVERWGLAIREMDEYIDFDQLRIETRSPTARDSILSSDPLTPFPSGPMRAMPPQDLGALIRNPDAHRILAEMLRAKQGMRIYRDLMKRNAEMLLERVRSAQAP